MLLLRANRQVRWLIGTAVVALSIFAAPSAATVYEIGNDGAVVVYDRTAPQLRTSHAPSRKSSNAAAPPSLRSAFSRSSVTYDVASDLIEAVAWAESRFRTDAHSAVGAHGVMQLMSGTARDLGVDRNDPEQNIAGGSSYLRRLLDRYHGDIVKTLAAYNAGPGAVDRYGGVPPFPETQRYVARILGRLAAVSAKPETQP